MKTPALIMLSALVALGHWLLLVPGTLAQVLTPAPRSEPAPSAQLTQLPAAAAPVRVLQTRRIESPAALPSARVLQAVRAQTRTTSTKPGITTATATVPATQAPKQDESSDLSTATGKALAEQAPSTDAETLVAAASEMTPHDNLATKEAEAVAWPSSTEVVASATSQPDPPDPPLAAQLIAQLQLPKPARLNYDITGQSKGLGYRASGVLDWRQDGSRYDARLVASVFFLGNRTLSSQGEVTADGLAPTRFADKARSEQAAHFQADQGKITFSSNTPDAPWQRGAQDRLSVFFQLAGMLAGQPERVAAGTRIPVYTASARSADTWAFLVDEIENLSLPAGTMPAIKLTRQNRLEYDQLVEVWFAPSLSYWPVRIKLTQRNGDFVDQQLASVVAP